MNPADPRNFDLLQRARDATLALLETLRRQQADLIVRAPTSPPAPHMAVAALPHGEQALPAAVDALAGAVDAGCRLVDSLGTALRRVQHHSN